MCFESEKNQPSRFIKDLDDLELKNLDRDQLDHSKYDMETEIKYWTDYMNLKYHERSYLTIPPYLQNMNPPSKESEPSEDFGFYANGLTVSKDKEFNENLYESLRHFCEETNFIQVSSKHSNESI